eukprot:gene22146-28251_t
MSDKLRSAEIMLASGNVKGVLNMLQPEGAVDDIVITADELEAYNELRNGTANNNGADTPSTVYTHDQDDYSLDHNGHSRSVGSRDSLTPHIRSMHDSRHSGGDVIDPGEYRPLTVDEEIMLLHHNSIDNRKRREEELKRVAAAQAEESAVQELRMKVFDDYWTALPRKEGDPNPRLKKKKPITPKTTTTNTATGETIDEEEEVPAVKLSKTAKMWKSVGTAYWRGKEEALRKMVEQKVVYSSDEDEGLLVKVTEQYNHLSDAVWKNQTAPQAPMYGRGANQVPDQSVSIRDLMVVHKPREKKEDESGDETPMTPGESTAPNSARSVRSNSLIPNSARTPRANTPKSGAPFTPRGPGRITRTSSNKSMSDKNDDPSMEGSITSVKHDPFSTTGKLEWLRYKVGMQAKAERTVDQDDDSYSVDSRRSDAKSKSVSPSKRRSSQTSGAKDSGPENFNASTSGGVQLTENSMNSSGQGQDDNMSVVTEMSQSSSVNHQSQVAEYLNMIDQPRDALSVTTSSTMSPLHKNLSVIIDRDESDDLSVVPPSEVVNEDEEVAENTVDMLNSSVRSTTPLEAIKEGISPTQQDLLNTSTLYTHPEFSDSYQSLVSSNNATPPVQRPDSPVSVESSSNAQSRRSSNAMHPVGILVTERSNRDLTSAGGGVDNDASSVNRAPKLVRFGTSNGEMPPLNRAISAPFHVDAHPTTIARSASGISQSSSHGIRSIIKENSRSSLLGTPPIAPLTTTAIAPEDEEGSLDGDADPRDNDSLPSIQISVSRGATVSNIGPLGADPHVIPTTLDRVQHAADLSRNSIKVKRGAPIHNAHQEFMPSFLPPSSPANFNHIQGIAQLPEQTQVHATKGILPFADLRVDVSLQQQPVTSNMGAFLEMQSVNSKGLPVSPIPGQNLIQKKNRIIFTDSPTAASVLSPTKSNSNLLQRSFSNMSSGGSVGSEERQEQQAQLQLLNQQRQQEFIAYQIAQHKQHMMASSGDHLAVKFDASPSRDQFDESMLPTYTTTPLPPPQEVFEAKGTPLFKPLQVETTAENTAALRVFEGLADHDLLDVADSAASNRLASRLGLRTAPLHPNKFSTDGHQSDDNNSPPRMHHLFHRGGADEADEEVSVGSNAADLNYENLLAMVQDFKSEQQLLRDRENAMSEEAHPVVSYFPSNFRKKLMKSSSTVAAEIEVEGHDADFETRKSPTHQRNERRLSKHAKESGVTLASVNNNNNSGNSLKLGSGSGLGTPPKGTPKGGKKERLNKNLTRKSFDSDTFDDLMVQNNTKNSNRPGSTEAHHAHVEEGEVNHILFPKSEALGEALKYIGEKYKFNADDVHGAQLSDAEIREVVQGINQYFQNQETLRHAPPVSPGRIRNLEMRFKAQQLREAQSLDATIDGQGGMFFKDPQEGRRNKTAEGGENSGRENKHTTLHATISIPSETTKPRAGTPPDFWVEVIKLFHPENEQFDDEHSTFSLDRRTPLTSSRRNVPTQQVPDIVLDVVKLNHPHVDASLYGSHVNSSGTPGPHTVGPRSKSRGGGANSDSFAAGNNTTNTNATTGGNGQDHMPSYVRTSVDNTLLANNQTTLLTVRPISKLESKPKSPQRRSVSPPQKQSRVPSIPLNNNNVKSKPVPINASSSITTSSGIKMTDEDFLETGMLTGTKLSKQGTVGSLEIDLTRPGSPSNAPPQSSPGTPKALNTSSILYLPTTKITTGASFMSYTEPDEPHTPGDAGEVNGNTSTSNAHQGGVPLLQQNNVQTPQKETFSGGLSAFFNQNSDNLAINSSFSSPMVLRTLPLEPPVPDSMSIYSKNSLNAAADEPAYLVIDDSNLTTQNTTPAVNFKPNLVINTERSQPVANGLESVSTPHSSLNITSEEVKKKHSHSVLQQSFTSGTSLENESSVTDDLSTEHGSVANDERNEVESVTHYLDDDDEHNLS